MRHLRTGLIVSLGGLASLVLAGCAPREETKHCAPVIAQRSEATLAYPGSTVLEHSAHEGSLDEAATGMPSAGQRFSVSATQTQVFDWYSNWLSSHGWSHTGDQTIADSGGAVSAYQSYWGRGDETFVVGRVVSAHERTRLAVTADQTLFMTGYLAPSSVLGCS